jgi:hypothetical protein
LVKRERHKKNPRRSESLPALGMTAVAGLTVVGVTRNFSVLVIHPCLIVGVAIDA